MSYVAALLSKGRVGHQFTQLFSARWFAETWALEYLHSDFVNGPNYNDWAAPWNEFFGFGVGEKSAESMIHQAYSLRIERPVPPRKGAAIRHVDCAQIVTGLPLDWVLLCSDYGPACWEAYGRGRWTETAQFFQRKCDASLGYQNTQAPENHALISVAMYRRTGVKEGLDGRWLTPDSYYFGVLRSLQAHFGAERILRPQLFTQGPREDFRGAAWDQFDIHVCDDQYPECYAAMKACIEADVFVGSSGGTTGLVRVLRHHRRLSIGLRGGTALGTAYPDGPNADPDGAVELNSWTLPLRTRR